jgi:molybdate transport system ATP-binding protein
MADELSAEFEIRFPSGAAVTAALRLPMGTPSVTVLFGPSGSGKTTVLRCLAGLDQPQAGKIACGSEVWYDAARGVWLQPQKRRIGFLFQDYALFPHLTIRQNVEYGLGRWPAEQRSQRAQAMLELFDLGGLGGRKPRQLSGGQLQRAALARALAPGPRLLLLDEPLSALDAPTRERLRGDLRRLLVRAGIPALVVTHDKTEAIALGDRMAVIIDGKVRQTGTVQEVLSSPADAAVALSVGVETVAPARVLEEGNGLLKVQAGGAHITAVDPGRLKGPHVFICIRAEDVILEKGHPSHGTARNHLAGRITAAIREGPVVRVVVDCGFPLVALVTKQSYEDLGLREGETVAAVVKATSVHLIPRGEGLS